MKMFSFIKAVLIVLVAAIAVAAQSKTITISHFKDEPVEIVSIKLDGAAIRSGEAFRPRAGWAKDLEITIKNVYEEPISFVAMWMVVAGEDSNAMAITNTNYVFGDQACDGNTASLAPGATAVMRHDGTFGDAGTPKPAALVLQLVEFSNNGQIRWGHGQMLRLQVDPDGIRKYVPISLPQVRYQFPKSYQPDMKLVKARAMVDDLPTCTGVFEQNVQPLCASWNCPHSQHCFVESVLWYTNLTELNNIVVIPGQADCNYPNCGKAQGACGGTHSMVGSNPACNPIESPVIIDVLGNGFALTDVAGGVVFDIAGTGGRSMR